MGTEVLRPQDVLAERFRMPPTFHRRRNNIYPNNGNLTNLIVHRKPNNPNLASKKSPRSDKKKTNENVGPKKSTQPGQQVTLLRRGESLDSLTSKINNNGRSNSKSPKPKPVDDLAVGGSGRIGPDSPEVTMKHIRLSSAVPLDTYAGSAFSMSPSPRSVPLPSFFSKKPFDDSATRDLRRLLRLE